MAATTDGRPMVADSDIWSKALSFGFGQTRYQCDQTNALYTDIKNLIFSHYDVIRKPEKCAKRILTKNRDRPLNFVLGSL